MPSSVTTHVYPITLHDALPIFPVILDHLGRAGQGTAADADGVIALAKLPRIYLKYSGVNYSSKGQYPFADVKPFIRRAYDAFGPRSEEHTSELQSLRHLVCRLLSLRMSTPLPYTTLFRSFR